MNIVAIDPGPEVSGVVILSPERRILSARILANTKIVADLRIGTPCPFPHVAIEMIASYGMPVGAEVFTTCTWIGRFEEAYVHSDLTARYFRKDIKLHLCGTTQAKDANVRQALIDLLGPRCQEESRPYLRDQQAHVGSACRCRLRPSRSQHFSTLPQ